MCAYLKLITAVIRLHCFPNSSLMLLVGWQDEHPTCKKTATISEEHSPAGTKSRKEGWLNKQAVVVCVVVIVVMREGTDVFSPSVVSIVGIKIIFVAFQCKYWLHDCYMRTISGIGNIRGCVTLWNFVGKCFCVEWLLASHSCSSVPLRWPTRLPVIIQLLDDQALVVWHTLNMSSIVESRYLSDCSLFLFK